MLVFSILTQPRWEPQPAQVVLTECSKCAPPPPFQHFPLLLSTSVSRSPSELSIEFAEWNQVCIKLGNLESTWNKAYKGNRSDHEWKQNIVSKSTLIHKKKIVLSYSFSLLIFEYFVAITIEQMNMIKPCRKII